MMRKYGSIIRLYIRMGLFRMIGVLILLAGAEGVMFYLRGLSAQTFSDAVDAAWLFPLFLVGYLLWFSVMIGRATKLGKLEYTYARLNVAEYTTVYLNAIVNAGFLLLLWGVQVLLLRAFYSWFCSVNGSFGPQGFLVNVLRDPFANGLIPVMQPAITVRNLLYLVTFSLAAADLAMLVRTKRKSVIATLALVYGPSGMNARMSTASEIAVVHAGFYLLLALAVIAEIRLRAHDGKKPLKEDTDEETVRS